MTDRNRPTRSTEQEFFLGKRPWSKIKDRVLGQYMRPYLSKVAKLGQRIILIDAFAGPGKFEDNQPGSPLIICNAAEACAPGMYLAIFANRQRDHHDRLSHVISQFVEKRSALAIHGTSEQLLRAIHDRLDRDTVFLYLDPFGLRGCEFSLLAPILRRDKALSTEVVINLSVPTIHRLATRKAIKDGRADTRRVRLFHQRLTDVLGGDYWKGILWNDDGDSEQRIERLMAAYRHQVSDLGPAFTGSCPVRERPGAGIKYYITFGSRHRDALLLMNDAMCCAYQERMHEATTEGTLFQGTDWKSERNLSALRALVVEAIRGNHKMSRVELWLTIVQAHFMRFLAAEFKLVVRELVSVKVVGFEDVRKTGRLNDDSRLFVRDMAH